MSKDLRERVENLETKVERLTKLIEEIRNEVWRERNPTCSEKGCTNPGSEYQFPDGDTIVLCSEHARQYGFCPLCGGFYGGVEFFEVHGVCHDCWSEVNDEEDELWEDVF